MNNEQSTGRIAQTSLMTEGTIWKKILFFSIPLIVGNMLQQAYNTVDSIIVGNYVGSNALAAVGAGTALINLLIAFSQGIAVGAGVVVSLFLGARKREGVVLAVHTSLALAILLGLALTIAGFFSCRLLLEWMKTPEEVMTESTAYLRIYFGGLLFSVVYNMEAGILNAAGNSRRSLLYLAIASLVNIVLDLVLVRGFSMGVQGAAIATDMSQAVSCVLAFLFLTRVPAEYRINPKQIRVQKDMALRIIKLGLPTGIQNMVISFSNVLVQSSINLFGAKAMAGFGAYVKIDGFDILPVISFSMAATTFTGQNYGAGKIERIKKGMWTTLLMGLIYTTATGALLLIFAKPVMGLFTKDSEVIEYGISAMWYFCPFYFLLSIMHGLAGTVRGTGKTIPPMLILFVSLCVFRIIWIFFVLPQFGTIQGVYILYPVSWVIGVVLMILYVWKGKWLSNKPL